MSEVKSGEIFNGGYTVNIGDYELRQIGSYTPGYANIYDSQNSYRDHNGNDVKAFVGRQFTLSIKTGWLVVNEYNGLIAALKKKEMNVSCPDFTGVCICDDFQTNLEQANVLNTRYSVTFKLAAKSLDAAGSL